MDEALKKLLSSEVLSEDTKKAITDAFNKAIKVVESEAEKRVRSELVKEFKNNETALHEAMEKWMEREIAPYIKELKEGAVQVGDMKKALADRGAKLEESLKEIYEKRSAAIEEAVEQIVKTEMGDLHDDVRTNRRAYLNAMNESKSRYARMEEDLKKKTAMVLEMFLEKTVRDMLGELRNEIKAANESDFGREIFEAYNSVYRRHFFNTNKEVKSLADRVTALSESNKRIKTEAKTKLEEAAREVATARSAHKKLTESVMLARTRNQLLSNLKGDAHSKMKLILESCTSVDAMKRNYKQYVTEFLKETRGSSSTKKALDEKVLKLKTGDSNESKPLNEEAGDDEDLTDIRHIKRLAGMN